MPDKYKINIFPPGSQILASAGMNLREVLQSQGITFPQNCGGKGKCGFCRIAFKDNPPPLLSREAQVLGEDSQFRLACIHKVNRDQTIYFPLGGEEVEGKVISNFKVKGGGQGYGLGVDLGTTLVAVYLLDFKSGRIIGSHSFLNPQTGYGGDIMTRVDLCKNPADNAELTRIIREAVSTGIEKVRAQAGICRDEIIRMTIAGNTAMTQIFLNLGGEGLDQAPFIGALEKSGFIAFDPEILGLSANCSCEFLPILSGFIGGDTAGAIIASDLDLKAGKRLLIDFGTNGEIVLADEGGIYATATAAGPAFEGVGMSCGLPAVKAAVEGIDDEGRLKIIGDSNLAMGICGSGYISVVAYLLKKGHLRDSGRLEVRKIGDKKWKLPVTNGPPLYISQEDIRKFQLAKGAISAGIEILCREAKVKSEDLDEVIITGSFGNRIDPEAGRRTGLIPAVKRDAITFLDNGAGRGAVRLLAEGKFRNRILGIKSKGNFINLGEHPDFQESFVRNMRLGVCVRA